MFFTNRRFKRQYIWDFKNVTKSFDLINLASRFPGHLIPNSLPNFLIVLSDIGLIESVAFSVIDINKFNFWIKSLIISNLV